QPAVLLGLLASPILQRRYTFRSPRTRCAISRLTSRCWLTATAEKVSSTFGVRSSSCNPTSVHPSCSREFLVRSTITTFPPLRLLISSRSASVGAAPTHNSLARISVKSNQSRPLYDGQSIQ